VITQTRSTYVNCNSDKVIHDASCRYLVLCGKALTLSSEAATTTAYPSPLFRNHKFVKNYHICLLKMEKFYTICHPNPISQFDWIIILD
jgi:hypothetical protein